MLGCAKKPRENPRKFSKPSRKPLLIFKTFGTWFLCRIERDWSVLLPYNADIHALCHVWFLASYEPSVQKKLPYDFRGGRIPKIASSLQWSWLLARVWYQTLAHSFLGPTHSIIFYTVLARAEIIEIYVEMKIQILSLNQKSWSEYTPGNTIVKLICYLFSKGYYWIVEDEVYMGRSPI